MIFECLLQYRGYSKAVSMLRSSDLLLRDVTDDCTLLDQIRRKISTETAKASNIDGRGWDVVAYSSAYNPSSCFISQLEESGKRLERASVGDR